MGQAIGVIAERNEASESNASDVPQINLEAYFG